MKKTVSTTKSKAGLKPHPAAEIFPLMTGEEFAALKEDIRIHGQRDPIIVKDGQIIDGRNRYHACIQLGIEPKTKPLQKGDSPAQYAISANMHRRHLTQSQKACAALMIMGQLEEEAKVRRLSGLKHDDMTTKAGKASEHAAEIFGTSARYIEMAKRIRVQDKRTFNKVFNGEIVLSRAVAQLRTIKHPPNGARITVLDLKSGMSQSIVLQNVRASSAFKRIAEIF